MFVYASDTDKCIYLVSLEVADGTVRGNVSSFSKCTDGCTKVVSMCLNNNVLYISHQGNTGGVVGVKMSRLSADVFLLKGHRKKFLKSINVFFRKTMVFLINPFY